MAAMEYLQRAGLEWHSFLACGAMHLLAVFMRESGFSNTVLPRHHKNDNRPANGQ
jgi:hypothetical protein